MWSRILGPVSWPYKSGRIMPIFQRLLTNAKLCFKSFCPSSRSAYPLKWPLKLWTWEFCSGVMDSSIKLRNRVSTVEGEITNWIYPERRGQWPMDNWTLTELTCVTPLKYFAYLFNMQGLTVKFVCMLDFSGSVGVSLPQRFCSKSLPWKALQWSLCLLYIQDSSTGFTT
jgi:hypothetical protein